MKFLAMLLAGTGGEVMKILLLLGGAYFAMVAVATYYSANEPGTTPTADLLATLPSPGLLVTGGVAGASTTAAMVDGVAAAAVFFFAMQEKKWF
jgi:hypothetical protein